MSGSRRPRVLIADDHTMVAEALKKLLETDFEIVGIVNNGRALVDIASKLNPDVVLVDVAMPLLNGLDASEQIRNMNHTIRIVFLTMNEDRALTAEAFRRGASGYLLKKSAASELLEAIRTVLRGKHYMSELIAGDIVDLKLEFQGTNRLPGPLTSRQKEVLQLLAEGRSMKEVGALLHLTARTVAFHKYRIMEVLHISNSAELVQYAVRERMVSLDNRQF
jgi:DNA-binding NarL/FixJ family response regulator